MVAMQNFFRKPVRTALGIALIGTMVADVAADGVEDFDYDGTARILEVNSSAPSSDPTFAYVEDPIIGDGNEVISPEGQRAGELVPPFKLVLSLDDLLTHPTDVSGGQAILHNWVPYRT